MNFKLSCNLQSAKGCVLFLFLVFLSAGVFSQGPMAGATASIVPVPARMKLKPGVFTIDPQTRLVVNGDNPEARRIATFFAAQLQMAGGPDLALAVKASTDQKLPSVVFSLIEENTGSPSGSYELKVEPHQIQIHAHGGAGLFYGVQSLLQLFPPEICKQAPAGSVKSWTIPCTEIKDHPRFPYRGMHLDVSRHFFPVEFVKRYIDLLAMYKMNTFHWHLTDDNGWRIEIKKYPKLTQVAAWRVDHENLPWNQRSAQQPGEPATYGGFYTRDEIREVVKYAADRYVMIIPEIEMPAHSVEVLAAYPQFSCTGGPFTVPPGSYWPNRDILCAGNDSVFTFLEDVLSEVMELFPSPYIHIGGDEADKTNWKKCPKCQERIKSEGLKDEKELQSYFIKRIEKFIVSKGKKMIGWDEILEGGLAPEATVMSWRGVEGGIAAARQGHDAIMTPGSHCYFDYYQADPQFEPKAIGGLTTLKKVYGFEPVPNELSTEEARHILGAQGNVWTEFIPTPSHAEYMALPRMIALAEVVWSPAKLRNWDHFRQRMSNQFKRLDYMGVNYSKGSFRAEVTTGFDKKTNALLVTIGSEQLNVPIHYTTNGDDVTIASPLYTSPFEIKKNGIIRAGLFVDGKLKEKTVEMPLLFHLAIGKPLNYLTQYSYRYPASGRGALNDGLRGSANHRDGLWQGYLGNDLEIIIDLGKEIPINSVQMNFIQNQHNWIFLPVFVEYSLSSDGKKYHSFNEVPNTISTKEEQVFIQPFNFQFMANTKARFVKVHAKNLGKCPSWHEGSGEDCWMFMDEIVVF